MATQDNGASDDFQAPSPRMVMVSNRLPVSLERDDDGEWSTQPSTGGLIAALDPVMAKRGGVWVGWPGVADTDADCLREVLDSQKNEDLDYRLSPVALSDEEIRGFYEGFSNEVIWPLFHNQFTACNFEPDYWRIYQEVNRKFAECVRDEVEDGDFIWVHDYHLINLAHEVRELDVDNRCGFFLHIPFPTVDIFGNLPWWREMLYALLTYDFIGLQTEADCNNLLSCIETLFDGVETSVDDDAIVLRIDNDALDERQRQLRIGALPIGIDYPTIERIAASEETDRFLRDCRSSWSAKQIALGVDRLDYTKGLPHKLKAFRNALERYPELRSHISLDQHVIPSREQVPEYEKQRIEIEQLVGEINGQFTQQGWVPIHYLFHRMPQAELMAHYRLADIALITPLKDGMNLVAKEYCAAKVDENGVLILSEFAGCAAELGDYALLVNPNDVEATADAIFEAYCMKDDERSRRMHAMRAIVRDNDAFEWVRRFMKAAGANEAD